MIGCFDVYLRVGDSNLPVCWILDLQWKVTRAMIVEVRYEMINVELIDESCLVSRNMPVTKFLTDDCSVLALDKSIVSTRTCSTLGLCYLEFVEETGYSVVDEFRAIV